MPNISDLTGTTWRWTFDHEYTGFGDAGNGTTKNINFTSNNENFSSMTFECSHGGDYNVLTYGASTVVINYDYDGESFYDDSTYQTFTITDGTDVTDSALIGWIESNATQVLTTYTITTTVVNLTASGDTGISDTATVTLSANTGYALPMRITVINADYTYNFVSGVISLSNPTDNVTIAATALTQEGRFNAVANGLVDTINDKADTSGVKKLDEALRAAETIVKPDGNINITSTAQTNVANYATAQVTDANLIAENIKDSVSVLGETGTFTHIESGGATASDILSGKKAYVNGAEVTGNIPSKSAATITPTTTDQTIAAGQYLAGAQTVEGVVCENLLPEYIAKDVVIKIGTATDDDSVTTVVGSYTGGSAPETPTDSLLFYSPNEIGLSIYNKTKNWNGTLYYSTDHTNWNTWDGTTKLTSAKTGEWHLLYLRGVGNTKITGQAGQNGRFVVIGSFIKCVGNCNNLLNYTSEPTLEQYAFSALFYQVPSVDFDITLPSRSLSKFCYSTMFYGCASLTKAPALPAGAMSESCYASMFSGCTSLTTAPALPATSLAYACYSYMFNGCVSLTTAPALPATYMGSNCWGCYQHMFDGCTSLTTAPALPIQQLAAYYCYASMFSGCTSLTTAPTISATNTAGYCYADMFSGCTSLTTAPALPATVLDQYCYQGMFYGCTSLTNAPALPATNLSTGCYMGMFTGCTSLTTAPALTATSLVSDCYRDMFKNCTSLTTAPTLSATALGSACYRDMFSGCTSLTTAPALPATTLKSGCYHGMFNGCTSLTNAPALPATTVAESAYAEMFRRCTSLTTSPALPATTLGSYCYYAMFYDCTSLTTIPALPTITLISYCYYQMFQNCRNIKLSTVQIDEYQTEFRVPISGTGTTASNALTSMFAGTGGTFIGAPTINTTYYTSNTVIYPMRTVTIAMTGDCPQIGGDVYDGTDTTGTYLGDINDGTTFNITSGHIYVDLGVYSDQYYNGATATNGITVTTDTAGAIGATVGLDGTLTINTYEH